MVTWESRLLYLLIEVGGDISWNITFEEQVPITQLQGYGTLHVALAC